MKKWWAAACVGVALAGVIVGLWPQRVETPYYSEVECGSVFLEDETPKSTARDPRAYEYGYDLPDERPSVRLLACHEALQSQLTMTVALLGGSFLGLAGLAVVGALSPSRRLEPLEFGAGTPPTSAAPAPPPPAPVSSREDYWRAQGWAPAEEMEGPPPGWVRRDGQE